LRCAATCLAICALAVSATVIDRIAVSVGNRVITSSDIDREIRVAAFLNGVKPDFSGAARRAAADRMVEQALVRLEVENSRYPSPTDAEVQAALDQFEQQHYPDSAAYRAALAEYGTTEQGVLNELIWQRTLLSYIDVRFRPAVQVSDQEIQDYFEKVVKPAAVAAKPGSTPALDEYRSRIEDTLTGKKEDGELNKWIVQAKQRTMITYHEEAFQ
jgi:hypothetical protein